MNDRLREFMRKYMLQFRRDIVNEERSAQILFFWVNILMGVVSLFMTIVNVITAKRMLMVATLIFCFVCVFNFWLWKRSERQKKISLNLFLTECLSLCAFFCVSGTPEGFSAFWTCFIPSFSFALIGSRKGNLYSALGLLMIVFFFWTPLGRSTLQYDYTSSFMLRFPMIYSAFWILALFLEIARTETQRQLKAAELHSQYLSQHDLLTGVYNRYGFNLRFDEIWAKRDSRKLALMILDLDYFKRINDTYGHDSGDKVLKFVADRISTLAGDHAVVCRWGGEEFTVLLSDEEKPEAMAERIRSEIGSAAIPVDGGTARITVSIGVVSVVGQTEATIAELVRGADKCLYEAKAAGRNTVVCDAI